MCINNNNNNNKSNNNKQIMRHQLSLLTAASIASTKAFITAPIAIHRKTKSADILPSYSAPTTHHRRRHVKVINHLSTPLKYKDDLTDTDTDLSDDSLTAARFETSTVFDEYTTSDHIESNAVQVSTPPILDTPQPLPGDCDVKSFINEHFKFYDGDESFLAGPTQRTQDALTKFKQLLTKEREAGGVLSVDAETPSTITSHEPGYLLSKEEDVIVGFQGDKPLQRTCKPHGGYGVVKKALDAYGYTQGEKLQAFKDNVVTHNDLTFSMYTDK